MWSCIFSGKGLLYVKTLETDLDKGIKEELLQMAEEMEPCKS